MTVTGLKCSAVGQTHFPEEQKEPVDIWPLQGEDHSDSVLVEHVWKKVKAEGDVQNAVPDLNKQYFFHFNEISVMSVCVLIGPSRCSMWSLSFKVWLIRWLLQMVIVDFYICTALSTRWQWLYQGFGTDVCVPGTSAYISSVSFVI